MGKQKTTQRTEKTTVLLFFAGGGMRAADIPQRVAEAKARVVLSALIGRTVRLKKRGREWSGLCPFHNERTPSFTVNDDKDFYHCFGCGAHGDAVGFLQEHDGLNFIAALERLETDAGLVRESAVRQRETVRQDAAASHYVDTRQAAAAVWAEAQGARGSIVEEWLRARRIDPDASGALDVIRYHPRCPAGLWKRWESQGEARRIAPAMVTPFLRVQGGRGARTIRMIGVHLTFLSADGREKAYFEPWRDQRSGEWRHPPRRVFWGSAKRGGVLLPAMRRESGAAVDILEWLASLLDAAGTLTVGEGLESTLSLMAGTPGARMSAATLSLDNMQGAAVRVGVHHALPLWNLAGDAAGAPFTVADAGEVVIGVDADMKPTKGTWVQERRGAPAVKRVLTSLERSQVCAGLASWHWRQAGAERVSVTRPPMGSDFNDLDQRRVA